MLNQPNIVDKFNNISRVVSIIAHFITDKYYEGADKKYVRAIH